MVEKWQTVRRVRKSSVEYLSNFNDRKIADFLAENGKGSVPMASITEAALRAMAELFDTSPDQLSAAIAADGIPETMKAEDFQHIKVATEAQVDAEIIQLEQRLGLLSSIVSASPFLGLLGTVWGVMMAFTGMAMEGRADIKAIAPGVSGALLTTVVGLLVAIPAVIGYNILVNHVKMLTVQLDNYAENLVSAIQIASTRDGGK